ncbi:sulfite exporter TauE/SafE family protein [Streptomyces sp. NPDC060194]|uniref:sulfite exporter TauE/SafE family protein n=1 Tax=Streptomyces sp. NPDC060194 TaxID=3347069 RepID=UPI00364AF47C
MDISVGPWGFLALILASTLVGFSKTAVNGANTITLAVFAAVLPARESTGILLPLLIVGDVLAVASYWRHAHWPTLLRMTPAVVAGVVVGTAFLAWADDDVMSRSIGAILLFMLAVTAVRRRKQRAAASRDERQTPDATDTESRAGKLKSRSYGALGGFTTMVANAGGPVMSLYLLSAGFRKMGFLGTSACFFLVVNVFKVPFSVGLGLIDAHSLLLDAALVGFVIAGAFLGRACVHRIDQKLFDRLVIGMTLLGGTQLLLAG